MDKRRAIQIMTKAAQLYKEHLEDQKVLFLYGFPNEVNKRLTENDFSFAKDGSTGQKLDILERMMLIKKNVTMIGEFTDRGPKLYTEKAAGNICGCIGFVKDKNTKLNVPNTLLKKDIRDVTAQPTYKVFAVISKHYTDEIYTKLVKMDKCIDLKECCFSETIENMIDRENL